jgi:hypothetical protein
VAVYDAQLDAVRIFDRRLNGKEEQTLVFQVFEDRLVDKQTRSQWTAEGACYYGKHRDARLTPVLAVDAMWFAWAAFHGDTDIFPFDSWGQPSLTTPSEQQGKGPAPLPPADSPSYRP